MSTISTTQITALSQQLGQALIQRQFQITTAESCTGGGIAYFLTEIPGSSAYIDRCFVTYSAQAKAELLHIPTSLIERVSIVSKDIVEAMLVGVTNVAGADVAIATTGVAGPSPLEGMPVGSVWLGCRIQQQSTVQLHQFSGDRKQIRLAAIQAALTLTLECLKNQ